MNDNKFCSACKIKIDENSYKKDRTVCKKCYNKKKRKKEYNTSIHETKITNVNNRKQKQVNNPNVSTYENHRHVIIGPSNVGKTNYMLKVLEKIGCQKPIHIITRSPNQNPNFKTSTDIKPINKYEGSIVIVDDMLGAKK